MTDSQTAKSVPISAWVMFIASLLCFAIGGLVIWALHGDPAGDKHDEEADFFMKTAPAVAGLLLCLFGVRKIQ